MLILATPNKNHMREKITSRKNLILSINGGDKELQVLPSTTLLDALREHLHLAGAKKGCDHGQCGACTVLVGGKHINSCLALAIMQEGKNITTIKGLSNGDVLHPVQEAFIAHDAFQCGYCTPGQILSLIHIMNMEKGNSPEEIRDLMSGNICRCGAYANI